MNSSNSSPVSLFLAALDHAAARGVDTTPVALATAAADGLPSVRMVLLRGVDERGFVFHTNYNSRKARELGANPQAAMCFHWHALEEQIRIEGRVERLSAEESDAYFATRPRGSQLGAWASDQSAVLASPATLEARYAEVERRFENQPVPRPPFWGGFRLIPNRVEFWYGKADRLHERISYTRDADGWRVERLYP